MFLLLTVTGVLLLEIVTVVLLLLTVTAVLLLLTVTCVYVAGNSHCCVIVVNSYCCVIVDNSHWCATVGNSDCCVSDVKSHCCVTVVNSHRCVTNAATWLWTTPEAYRLAPTTVGVADVLVPNRHQAISNRHADSCVRADYSMIHIRQRTYHFTSIQQTIFQRGWEDGSRLVSLLLAGSPSHTDNALWNWKPSALPMAIKHEHVRGRSVYQGQGKVITSRNIGGCNYLSLPLIHLAHESWHFHRRWYVTTF